MMGLIQDQHAAGTKITQPIQEGGPVGLVNQKPLGNQKSWMRGPGIDSESSVPANLLDVAAVKDGELQTEPALQFFLPLEEHRRRAGDHDLRYLLAHKQLPRNQ